MNQISDIQAWIMGVNITGKIDEKRREDVKAGREEELFRTHGNMREEDFGSQIQGASTAVQAPGWRPGGG